MDTRSDRSYLDWMLEQEEQVEAAPGAAEGGIWVIAEVVNGSASRVTLEALGAARGLADGLGAYIDAVVVGSGIRDLASVLFQAGANRVLLADHPSLAQFALEPYMVALTGLLDDAKPEIVMLGATPQGEALAPRLAQRSGGGLIEHVTTVELDERIRAVLATIPIYGGEYSEVYACPGARPQFLTVEPGAFQMPFLDPYRRGEPEEIEVIEAQACVRVVAPAEGFEPAPVLLEDAHLVVAGGREAGNFSLVEELAAALGAHLAGDRGARDKGWVSADRVVDVRGVHIRPQVYVAVGIRGDTFHNAAIEDAKFVLAIHPDPQAPIFAIADVCIEADPCEVVPEIIKALDQTSP